MSVNDWDPYYRAFSLFTTSYLFSWLASTSLSGVEFPLEACYFDVRIAFIIFLPSVHRLDDTLPELMMWLLFGIVWSGFERFLAGVVFHGLTPAVPHEQYHQRLRERKGNRGIRNWKDDALECVGYELVYSLLPIYSQWFWIGWWMEHWLGMWLRMYVQYTPSTEIYQNYDKTLKCQQFKCRVARWWRRFLVNADFFYGYHLVIHPKKCLGFGTPFWDKIFNTLPPEMNNNYHLIGGNPVSFLDFFDPLDLTKQHKVVIQGWEEYNNTPDKTDFQNRILQLE